ncbi:MAG: hypothetical protein ABII82_16830 [Verrucomicrobiota bacterium]
MDIDPFNGFFRIDRGPATPPAPPVQGGQHSGARLSEIEFKLERLSLITHALWDLLKDRHGYTDEELNDWINLTDLKDGRLDGRYKADTPPLNCPKCGRVVGRTQGRCIYCGGMAAPARPFDRVG